MRTAGAPVRSFKSSVWPLIDAGARDPEPVDRRGDDAGDRAGARGAGRGLDVAVGAAARDRRLSGSARGGAESTDADDRDEPSGRGAGPRRPRSGGDVVRADGHHVARRAQSPGRLAHGLDVAHDDGWNAAEPRGRERLQDHLGAHSRGITEGDPERTDQRKVSTWWRARRSWFSQRSYRVSIASL
jgi:hypothetical protein